jgi:hypothetical protein
MKRQWLAIAFMVATVGCGGCGSSSSSSSSSGGNDMDKMAAAIDQHNASQASTASAGQAASGDTSASASNATQPPAVASSAAPAAAADPSLASKRGFDLDDWNEASYVLVKGDAAKTAETLAGVWKGNVVKDVLGQPAKENAIQMVVFQLAGHPWSVFACDARQFEEVTKALSDTDVLVAWQSDFNGWSGIELYRGGEEVEAVHWGPDEDKLGEDADAAKWQTRAEVVRKNEDDSYNDAFLFRSKARKIAVQDLQKGDAFIDEMFRAHDAYLPDSLQMPWAHSEDGPDQFHSPLPPSAFSGVHVVEVADK